MKCPKCNKNLVIQSVIHIENSGNEQAKHVIGRCEKCDFDGTWIINYKDKKIKETNLERYFFG